MLSGDVGVVGLVYDRGTQLFSSPRRICVFGKACLAKSGKQEGGPTGGQGVLEGQLGGTKLHGLREK